MDISDLGSDDPITTVAQIVAGFFGQFTDSPVSISEAKDSLTSLILPFSMVALGAVFATLAILFMLIALLGRHRSRVGSALALAATGCFVTAWISLWLDTSYDIDAVLGSFLLAMLAVFAFLAWLLGRRTQRYLLWTTGILLLLSMLDGFSTWAYYTVQHYMGWI